MKSKKRSYPPIFIGSSFMLVIFIVLCMVIFALLSFSSAKRDFDYSLKNAQRTTEYYKANNLAEKKLAQIVSDMETTDAGTVSFTVPINDTEQLEVILELFPNETPCYQILSWKQSSTRDWNGDQSLPVLSTN